MDNKEKLIKHVREYAVYSFLLSFFNVVLILAYCWYLFVHLPPLAEASTRINRYRFSFPYQMAVLVPMIVIQIKKTVLIIMDLVTGCQVNVVIASWVLPDVDMMSNDSKPKRRHFRRYYTWTARNEQSKKIRILIDRNYYYLKFLNRNMYTVQVLRYSHFLVNAIHGKKPGAFDAPEEKSTEE